MIDTRQGFTDYCLRRLGEPVIKVNLDPLQISDAVDDAIKKFTEYHRDGYEEYFYVYEIPEPPVGEQVSRVIKIPTELKIDEVISVVPAGSPLGGRFDTYAWQAGAAITSPATAGWSNTSLQDFVIMTRRLETLNTVLGEHLVVKHNKYKRTITMMFDVVAGETYAFKTYRKNDPNVEGNEDAWNDQWLQAYATACIKERWGSVLTKVSGVRLVGGVEINGQEIYSTAVEEKSKLEEELKLEHQLPPEIFIG